MTYLSIQTEVLERMDLTSTTASARIGRSINELHRRICSSVGMQTTDRVPGVNATTIVGNRFLTFGPGPGVPGVEKIENLYNTAFTPVLIMDERPFDSLQAETPTTDPPTEWALSSQTWNSVTVFLNTVPATAYVLTADVLANVVALSGNMSPLWPEDYHDVLIYGAMAIELEKKHKYDLAEKQWEKYDGGKDKDHKGGRLAELRYWFAKSNWKDIYQGRNTVPFSL